MIRDKQGYPCEPCTVRDIFGIFFCLAVFGVLINIVWFVISVLILPYIPN